MQLTDLHGRTFRYLRLSVTDVCNFRCRYCLPDGYQRPAGPRPTLLNPDEIQNLAEAFAEWGVGKVRITGGEPTLRKDIVEIVRRVAGVPGIRKVALTTNAYRLKKLLPDLLEAGLTHLNVSLDSLNAEGFHAVTGSSRFQDVMAGVEEAVKTPLTVKVNTVLLKGVTDGELGRYVDWVRHMPVSVRFIELMQTGTNAEFFAAHHLSPARFRENLLSDSWVPVVRSADGGPAEEFKREGYAGKIGLIAPYSRDFCKGCNRLRVTSRGGLRLCLFGEGSVDLRPYLDGPESRRKLQERVASALRIKMPAHGLADGITGDTPHLAALGG